MKFTLLIPMVAASLLLFACGGKPQTESTEKSVTESNVTEPKTSAPTPRMRRTPRPTPLGGDTSTPPTRPAEEVSTETQTTSGPVAQVTAPAGTPLPVAGSTPDAAAMQPLPEGPRPSVPVAVHTSISSLKQRIGESGLVSPADREQVLNDLNVLRDQVADNPEYSKDVRGEVESAVGKLEYQLGLSGGAASEKNQSTLLLKRLELVLGTGSGDEK